MLDWIENGWDFLGFSLGVMGIVVAIAVSVVVVVALLPNKK